MYFNIRKTNKMPFDLFVTMKDDILFVTNSEVEVNKILLNKFVSNTGKHKSLIKKNVGTFYLNNDALINQLPKQYFTPSQLENVVYLQKNIKEAFFISSKYKRNKIHAEQIIKTSKDNNNSLQFVLNMIQKFTARPNRYIQ